MPDREKILHELDHQVADADWCDNDWKDNVPIWMLRGALALLREQEPRVMTLEEIRMHEVYWAEQENVSRPWPIAMHHSRNAGLLDGPVYQDYMGDNYNTKEYGKTWRCWTVRPTDEQRKAVKWDAAD